LRDDIRRRVDDVRRRSSEVENHLIDEYRAGRISRRELLRRGSVIGMSLPLVGFLASACGTQQKGTTASPGDAQAKVRPGGTIVAGIQQPAAAIDPVLASSDGQLAVLAQSGEYLAWSNALLQLEPRLAESWSPNRDASAWTFKIRRGVTFHDGTPMDARDVVATYERLVDPKNSSNALSNFRGVLSKGNTRAVDAHTVEFRLDAPNGNFPYLCSSDNYNTIILPRSYDGDWAKNGMIGTGPFKLDRFDPASGVSYVKNPSYWDKRRQPNPDRTELRFYGTEQARVLALQGAQLQAVGQFSVSGGRALLTDPNVRTIVLKASTHRQVHMRCDRPPFDDKRVRQAMALAANRDAMVRGLFEGKASLGNDSPFAPMFKSTDRSVAQRRQDLEQARALLQQAGKAGGFTVPLSTWDGFEIPDLAQLLQNDVKPLGVRLNLNITDSGTYYGDAVFGKSPWLDSTMGITDYGHRGVPNVFLGAPYLSDGTWNAAHYRNRRYDRLYSRYVAALDLGEQRRYARQIQETLKDDVPVMIHYFYDFLTGVRTNVAGVETTAMAHIDLTRAGFTG
jgi:peptide/nickel transport system substrate-binding protein